MDCEQAGPFVSTLHDGESVPPEAAQHIIDCPTCSHRLRDYAEIAAELRLLASAQSHPAEGRIQLPSPPRIRGRWLYALTRGVSVPRFAVVLTALLIVGLSVGLGLAQNEGPWFQFDISSPDDTSSAGGVLRAGTGGQGNLNVSKLSGSDTQKASCLLRVLEIKSGSVRLEIRVGLFPLAATNQAIIASLKTAPPQEYWYVSGETLRIPVNGFGDLKLTGRISKERSLVGFKERPLVLEENEVALRGPVLVKEKQLVSTMPVDFGVTASGNDSAVAFYAPQEGLFVLALHPFEGAIEGRGYWGRLQFNLDGADYTVFSATPITGGSQPRSVWIHRYWISGGEDSPVFSGDLSHLLQDIRMKK